MYRINHKRHWKIFYNFTCLYNDAMTSTLLRNMRDAPFFQTYIYTCLFHFFIHFSFSLVRALGLKILELQQELITYCLIVYSVSNMHELALGEDRSQFSALNNVWVCCCLKEVSLSLKKKSSPSSRVLKILEQGGTLSLK